MNILGISCYFHDASAALLQDGQLTAAAEEERFTRKKHDPSFPVNAIAFCLRRGKIRREELDLVVFFEKPFLKFERILTSAMQTFPRSSSLFRESMITWLTDKLWVKGLIRQHLGVSADRVLFSDHHLSHAASAFLCSPFDEAAILTVDGVGEWATATYGVGRGSEIKILQEIRFPHSLGLLYSAFTAFLGFEVNEGEFKVMGMASFGKPRYAEKVWKLVHQEHDGSFRLDMDYFSFHRSPDRMYNARFVELFGPPRDPDAPFDARSRESRHYADVAASIQFVTEAVLLGMAGHLHRATGLRTLCMAGGVALNSVANGRILRETPFEDIYVQPAAGDGGGALGAALYAYHTVLGKPREFVMKHAYWGEDYDTATVDTLLRSQDIRSRRLEQEDQLIAEVVQRLQGGKVVGWLQGRFEWGPRALGHRSILADPRNPAMRDIVNTKVKLREPFRPFAPSVLTDRAGDFFELPDAGRHFPARYMLYVVDVKDAAKARVPAVTHVDGTARVHTVEREVCPRYHRLIEAFGIATGTPVLLNTSFNLQGEPIVNTPAEALATFWRSGMDTLVLGDHMIEK